MPEGATRLIQNDKLVAFPVTKHKLQVVPSQTSPQQLLEYFKYMKIDLNGRLKLIRVSSEALQSRPNHRNDARCNKEERKERKDYAAPPPPISYANHIHPWIYVLQQLQTASEVTHPSTQHYRTNCKISSAKMVYLRK
ncbi:hypothetical protein Baya_2298 [Bagarius yarrelli]|uniref:Uncharacterized protein n=1 Tax=Bagarius yarrelli TaxID=175774 RepID=A0A556TNJ6_BAGYA|nr:hypothetical protein Baya_2298 [Bagarius yarrelli]